MNLFDLPQMVLGELNVLDLEKLKNFRFLVQIDGEFTGKEFVAGFHEITGLGDVVDVSEVKEGGYPGVHRFPRRTHQDALVLKRGMTFSRAAWKWFEEVRHWTKGRPTYKRTMSVFLLDHVATPVGQIVFEAWRWDYQDAWPSDWQGPQLNAQQPSIAFESMTIQHSGIAEAKGLLSGKTGELLSIFQ